MNARELARAGSVLALACILGACSPAAGPGGAEGPEVDADLSASAPRPTGLYTGATAVSLTPTFYWSELKGATSYDLYLSTLEDAGSSPLVAGIAGPPYALPSDLALSSGTLYRWKVVARNASSQSLPSPVQSFTTRKVPGFAAPAYASPSDGSSLYPAAGFSWAAVAGATNYRFLCSTASDASGGIAWDKGTATSESASGYFFLPGHAWYWKVVAEDAATSSEDSSAVWSFTPKTDGIAAPGAVSVDSSYRIAWDAVAGASKYFVILNYSGIAFTEDSLGYSVSSGTSFDASWLSSGTIGYAVVAVDAAGNTSYAASAAAAGTFVR